MKATSTSGAHFVALLLGTAVISACGTTRTFVDYSRGSLYSTETAGNVPYVEIGPVAASQRGFFWENCYTLAEKAVEQVRADAAARGANNVIAVRWLNHADGSYTETPICTTGWGWFAAFIAPGFGPWVKATELQGRLVRSDETHLARLREGNGRIAASPPPAAANAAEQAAPAAASY